MVREFLTKYDLLNDEVSREIMADLNQKDILFRNYCLGLEAAITIGSQLDKLRCIFYLKHSNFYNDRS